MADTPSAIVPWSGRLTAGHTDNLVDIERSKAAAILGFRPCVPYDHQHHHNISNINGLAVDAGCRPSRRRAAAAVGSA